MRLEHIYVSQSALEDSQYLVLVVRLIDKPVVTNTGGNFVLHAFWQVHRVRNGNDEQPRVLVAWPVEQVVEQCLLFCHQSVQLVDQYDSDKLSLLLGLLLQSLGLGSISPGLG